MNSWPLFSVSVNEATGKAVRAAFSASITSFDC
jgi:hypothetical protein